MIFLLAKSSEYQIIDGVQRSWNSFKLKAQARLRSAHFRFSPEIEILQIPTPNRVEFWFDQPLRRQLAEKLAAHEGPIISLLDPVRMRNDSELAKLFDKPNYIRGFSVLSSSSPLRLEFESLVAQPIEQKPSASVDGEDCLLHSDPKTCLRQYARLAPDDPQYFISPYQWGFLEIAETSRLKAGEKGGKPLASLTLQFLGSRMNLPSPLLAALALHHKCSQYQLGLNQIFEFKNCSGSPPGSIKIPESLNLFFYSLKDAHRIDLYNYKPSDKILILEVTDPSSTIPTALGDFYSPGEILATGMSNLLKKDYSSSPTTALNLMNLLFALALLCLIWMYQKQEPLRFLEVLVAVSLIFIAFDFISFVYGNIRYEVLPNFFALSSFGLTGLAILSRRSFERRNLIEKALGGYVSQDRLQRLISGQEKLELAGQRKELTTLLLDIAGFSVIAKEMNIADVFKLIQEFFSVIDPIIFEHKGVIDKKMGDGLLAFFGDSEQVAPQQAALRATEAAYQIQQRIQELDASYFGLREKLQIRIGINSGMMMIGNAGSTQHFNYTVLGDAVNYTERLESACQPGEILVGESTADFIKNSWKLERREIPVKHEEMGGIAFRVVERIK